MPSRTKTAVKSRVVAPLKSKHARVKAKTIVKAAAKPARVSLPNEKTERPEILTRTIPLQVQRHSFGQRRKANLSAVDTEQSKADKTLLSLSKRLLNCDELRAIKLRDHEFRSFLTSHATPFSPGFYLVPYAMVERVSDEATRWEQDRRLLVDAAGRVYPTHVQAMKTRLGALYNERDYPSPEGFMAAFWVSWRFVDFGAPGSQLKSFREDIWRREREKVERVGAQAASAIEGHLLTSCHEITDHLSTLLAPRGDGKKPALRGGALDDLLLYLSTFDARNTTEHRPLTDVVTRLRDLSKGVTLDILRDDDARRQQMAEAMASIKSELDKMIEEGPVRGIRFRDE